MFHRKRSSFRGCCVFSDWPAYSQNIHPAGILRNVYFAVNVFYYIVGFVESVGSCVGHFFALSDHLFFGGQENPSAGDNCVLANAFVVKGRVHLDLAG